MPFNQIYTQQNFHVNTVHLKPHRYMPHIMQNKTKLKHFVCLEKYLLYIQKKRRVNKNSMVIVLLAI